MIGMKPAKSKNAVPAPGAASDNLRPPGGRLWERAVLVAGACLVGGCEDPHGTGVHSRRPDRPPLLDAAKLDDCAARFADALRRWPVVERAKSPVLLASPGWRNRSPVPVEEGPALARRLAEAVNLRAGAKVRIAGPGEVGCHYGSELVLSPGADSRGQPVLALTWRVIRPGTRTSLLEAVATVQPIKPPSAPGLLFAPADEVQAGPARARRPRSYHAITFERGRVHLDTGLAGGRVTILGERSWRDADARLRINLRLLSRPTATPIEVLAYYVDRAGRRHSPTKALAQTLAASRTTTLAVTLPKAAQTYDLFLVVP